jgi:hypothetical protein
LYSDVGILTDPMYCYFLLPIQGSPPALVGGSDAICSVGGLRAGSAPSGFSLRLNESNVAVLTWLPPPGALGANYLLAVLNGNGLQAIPLSAGSVIATNDTGGQTTCYAVYAFLNGAFVGNTDALCGIPGLAHF